MIDARAVQPRACEHTICSVRCRMKSGPVRAPTERRQAWRPVWGAVRFGQSLAQHVQFEDSLTTGPFT
jgi:hypothetical protein